MASLRQIAANRRNSQRSTGPRSAEGKAASRWNALKSGIDARALVIRGEEPAELDALAADYHHQFQPANALESFLADSLARADWQLRRLHKIEAQIWEREFADTEKSYAGLEKDSSMGQVFSYAGDAMKRLHRRIEAVERSFYRALAELRRLREGVSAASPEPATAIGFIPPPPEPAPQPQPAAARPIGFVLCRRDSAHSADGSTITKPYVAETVCSSRETILR